MTATPARMSEPTGQRIAMNGVGPEGHRPPLVFALDRVSAVLESIRASPQERKGVWDRDWRRHRTATTSRPRATVAERPP